jgi:GR25 family glycosyltransferase involved in LPS biosynthesis
MNDIPSSKMNNTPSSNKFQDNSRESSFQDIDKIFVINLDHRIDRWKHIEKEFERVGISKDLYERFSAIKPNFKDIPVSQYNQMTSPIAYTNPRKLPDGRIMADGYNSSYIVGAIGCKLSHYNIIKLSKERGYKNVLIFEDDVIFKVNDIFQPINNAMKELDKFDFLFLSGNHLSPPMTLSNKKYIKKVSRTLTTHAYIVNCQVFDRLLENMIKIPAEIDVYYIEVEQMGSSYTLSESIATQMESYSDVLNRNVNYTNIVK